MLGALFLLIGSVPLATSDPIQPDHLGGALSGKINGFIEHLNVFRHRYEDAEDDTTTVYQPYYYPYPLAYPYPVTNVVTVAPAPAAAPSSVPSWPATQSTYALTTGPAAPVSSVYVTSAPLISSTYSVTGAPPVTLTYAVSETPAVSSSYYTSDLPSAQTSCTGTGTPPIQPCPLATVAPQAPVAAAPPPLPPPLSSVPPPPPPAPVTTIAPSSTSDDNLGSAVPSSVLAAVRDAYSEEDRLAELASLGGDPFKFDFNKPPPEAQSLSDSGSVTIADRSTFPALYDSGVAVAVFQLQPCALVVPHSHPRASETIVVTNGQIHTQFAAGKDVPLITNDLSELQSTFFPQGSLHYEINPTCNAATFISSFSSDDPGSSVASTELFAFEDTTLAATFGLSPIDGSNIEVLRSQLPTSVVTAVEQCLNSCNIQKRSVDLALLRSFEELRNRYRGSSADDDSDDDDDYDDDDDDDTITTSRQELTSIIRPILANSRHSADSRRHRRPPPRNRVVLKPVEYERYEDSEWVPVTGDFYDYDFLDSVVSFFQDHPEDIPVEVQRDIQVSIPEGEMPDPISGQSPNSPSEKRAVTPWKLREMLKDYFTSGSNFDSELSGEENSVSAEGTDNYVETGILSRVAAHRILDYLSGDLETGDYYDDNDYDPFDSDFNYSGGNPTKRDVTVDGGLTPERKASPGTPHDEIAVPLHQKQAVYSPPDYAPEYFTEYPSEYSPEEALYTPPERGAGAKPGLLQRLAEWLKSGKTNIADAPSSNTEIPDYDGYVPIYYGGRNGAYREDAHHHHPYPDFYDSADGYYWDHIDKRQLVSETSDPVSSLSDIDSSISGDAYLDDQQQWWDAFWQTVADMLNRQENSDEGVNNPTEYQEPPIVPPPPEAPSTPTVPGRLPPVEGGDVSSTEPDAHGPASTTPDHEENSEEFGKAIKEDGIPDGIRINDESAVEFSDDGESKEYLEPLSESIARLREELTDRLDAEELLEILKQGGGIVRVREALNGLGM